MISRYFVLAEFMGWLGTSIFAINTFVLISYYLLLLTSKEKSISLIWSLISIAFEFVQIPFVCLFIVALIDPESLSGQGKLDQYTAEYVIKYSIVCLVMALVSMAYNFITQMYWGTSIKGEKIWMSGITYQSNQIEETDRFYKIGKKKKWKPVYKKTKTGNAIKEYLQNKKVA